MRHGLDDDSIKRFAITDPIMIFSMLFLSFTDLYCKRQPKSAALCMNYTTYTEVKDIAYCDCYVKPPLFSVWTESSVRLLNCVNTFYELILNDSICHKDFP